MPELDDQKSKPTSLKLPPALKAQIEDLAKKAGVRAHAFMVQAIADPVQRIRLRETFALDAANALRDMRASGLGHELGDVRKHFSKLALHRRGQGPKPPALRPKRLA